MDRLPDVGDRFGERAGNTAEPLMNCGFCSMEGNQKTFEMLTDPQQAEEMRTVAPAPVGEDHEIQRPFLD
ncbi:MAG: hypothetical protein ABIN58_12205 [candidate division WOR-3 bacterium]